MKKQFVRKRNVHCKYITPAILLASGWAPLVADAQNIVGQLWQCVHQTPYGDRNGTARNMGYFLVGVDTPYGARLTCNSKSPGLGVLLVSDGGVICVPSSHVLYSDRTFSRSSCRVRNVPTPGLAVRSGFNNATLHYNSLLALCSAHPGPAASGAGASHDSGYGHPGLRLGRIVLALATAELNRASATGEILARGERIDARKLTAEQRRVLQNHMGLMKEALRQIKAEQAEQSKNGSATLEHAAGGTGDEALTDSMRAPR